MGNHLTISAEVLPAIIPELWIGLPAPIWLTHLDSVRAFIKENRLEALDRRHFLADDPIPIVRREREGEALAVLRRPPFPGGIRIPHLHFEGEIFTLSRQQWESFAEARLAEVRSRLADVQRVSFTELVHLSHAVDTLV